MDNVKWIYFFIICFAIVLWIISIIAGVLLANYSGLTGVMWWIIFMLPPILLWSLTGIYVYR